MNRYKFYTEYMVKRKPKVPACICKNKIYKWLGIVSPSLYWVTVMGSKGEMAAEEVTKFEIENLKYGCYKRKLNKKQWKALQREIGKI